MTLLKTLLLPIFLLAATVGPGWLGVFLDVSDDGRPSIIEVVAGSPAEKAGILAGDVLLAIDGQEVTTTDAVVAAVGAKEAGTKVKITLRREGSKKDVEVTLGTKPADAEVARAREEGQATARREAEMAAKAAEQAKADRAKAAEQARVEKARAAQARAEKAKGEEKVEAGGRPFLGVALDSTDAGVRVGEVLADGPAAAAGLVQGALLVAIGDAEIKTLADVDAMMGKLRAGQKVGIKVRGDDGKTRTHEVVLGRATGEARASDAPGRDVTVAARKQQVEPRRVAVVDRAVAAPQGATDAAFRTDVKEALRAARGKQPVLLVFGAGWDSGSKALRRSLADETVRKAIADVAVVWVDTDRDGRLADEFAVQQIPHMVALDPQGKKVGEVEGYQPPEVLLEKFAAIRAKAEKARAEPRPVSKPDVKPDVRVQAKPAAKAETKPATDKPVAVKPDKKPETTPERDLEGEVRALRDEIRELRQLLRELLKEKEKRG